MCRRGGRGLHLCSTYTLICHDIFTSNSLFQILIDLNINTGRWRVQGEGKVRYKGGGEDAIHAILSLNLERIREISFKTEQGMHANLYN